MGADSTATVIPRTFGVGGQGRLHAAIGANASVHIVVDGSGQG
jgi:hypothetical protein